MSKLDKITPGVLLPSGETYYPTGLEWLLAFATAGCKWAEVALEEYRAKQGKLWAGNGI